MNSELGKGAKKWASDLWNKYFHNTIKNIETIQVWRFGDRPIHAKQFKEVNRKPNGGFDVTITTCWAPRGNLTREIFTRTPDGNLKAGIISVDAKTGQVVRAFGKPDDKNVQQVAHSIFSSNPLAKSAILGRI